MTIRDLFIRLGLDPPDDLPEDGGKTRINAVDVMPEECQLKISVATMEKELGDNYKQRIRDHLPGLIANLKEVYFEEQSVGKAQIAEYLRQNRKELIARVKALVGGSGIWLDHSRWEYRENQGVVVTVMHDMARESLLQAKADRAIAGLLRQKIGGEVKVEIVRGEIVLPPPEELPRETVAAEAAPKEDSFRPEQILGPSAGGEPRAMSSLQVGCDGVVLEGELIDVQVRDVSGGKFVNIGLTDFSGSVTVKFFEPLKRKKKVAGRLEKLPAKSWLRVRGEWMEESRSEGEFVLRPDSIRLIAGHERVDTAPRKRIELHCHSQFSRMDATTGLAEFVQRAAKWEHAAVAITDHGVVQAFPEFAKLCRQQGIKPIYGMEGYLVEKFEPSKRARKPYHVIVLVKKQQGMRGLYQLVSEAHMETFYRRPLMPREKLQGKREGLLIGSACEQGELYQLILDGSSQEELVERAAFYDYIEIQPLDNNAFLIDTGRVADRQALEQINRRLYDLGKALGKPVVATSDTHYLDPQDGIFRQVFMDSMNFDDVERPPSLFFRTTDEMLVEFSYLGERAAEEVVVDNPQLVNEMIDDLLPMPEKFCPPIIPGADEELRDKGRQAAKELYGEKLPALIEERLEREITAITKNNYSAIFLIASRLVKKSLADGYIVGSRGSVGSSLMAMLLGVTEVNPLPPHYRCPACVSLDFSDQAAAGVDLPEKKCSDCGGKMLRDGYDIPFEVFMGFHGEKVPDIDLNFSGEYQARALRHAEEIFGTDFAYRAGTISGVQNRIAYGLVMKYFEKRKQLSPRRAEVDRLVKGCSGVKKTTGQHPGGVMFVPKGMDIYDFTPIQYPADSRKGEIVTTHFDCDAIHDIMVKLDILGHDNPTSLRNLCGSTGKQLDEILLTDPDTMALFSGWGRIEVDAQREGLPGVGTLGIPEFGTEFVIKMLEESRPKSFNDLICVSGLSHGTNVWLYNARELVRAGTADLSTAISVRDNIMLFLIKKGLPEEEAFNIMEKVRKGKGLTPAQEQLMEDKQVPEWYRESCKKITYMFPKAHAVAYVVMAFKIAYFKVHYAEFFYADCFSNNVSSFDLKNMCQGKDVLRRFLRELNTQLDEKNKLSPKENSQFGTAKIVREMYARGIDFLPVDLHKSQPRRFEVDNERIRPPLIVLPGVAESTASAIARERTGLPFKSVENLSRRTGANRTVVAALREHGCLEGLPDTDQGTLF